VGTTSIKRVTAVRDATDRLEWQVTMATDIFGVRMNHGYVLNWEGSVGLYRQPDPPRSLRPSLQVARLGMQARWTNRHEAARLFIPTEKTFEFATDLPVEALDRVEAFRAGGRLFARLEGRVVIVFREGNGGATPWFDDALALISSESRVPCCDVFSDSYELTRDVWGSGNLGGASATGPSRPGSPAP
jgi:hypothetical protein